MIKELLKPATNVRQVIVRACDTCYHMYLEPVGNVEGGAEYDSGFGLLWVCQRPDGPLYAFDNLERFRCVCDGFTGVYSRHPDETVDSCGLD